MGKKSRDKGYRGEYNLVKRLHELGIQAKECHFRVALLFRSMI